MTSRAQANTSSMGRQIILVRHAIAEPRDRARWPDDRKRPLTPHGRQRFRKAAAGLARWLPEMDLVLASPLTRARQTAAILREVAGWPAARISARLAPHGKSPAVLALLEQQQARRIA
jgi:phosphohistidine phosphatase